MGVISRCEPEDRDPERPAEDQVWCLFTSDGSRVLGRHLTKEAALAQERAVEANEEVEHLLAEIQEVLTEATFDKAYVEKLRKMWRAAFAKKPADLPEDAWMAKFQWDREIIGDLAKQHDLTKRLHAFSKDMSLEVAAVRDEVVLGLGIHPNPESKDPVLKALRRPLEALQEVKAAVDDATSVLDSHLRGINGNGWEWAIGVAWGKLREADAAYGRKFLRSLTTLAPVWTPEPVETEVSVGALKLVLDVSTTYTAKNAFKNLKRGLPDYVGFVKKAKALLDKAGAGKLWYGLATVRPPDEAPPIAYANYSGNAGGNYNPSTDQVNVWLDPGPFVTELFVHELGHRFYFKFMSAKQRGDFDATFNKVPASSAYGKVHEFEDFAEAFTWYVRGRQMAPVQKARMRQILAGKDFRLGDLGHEDKAALQGLTPTLASAFGAVLSGKRLYNFVVAIDVLVGNLFPHRGPQIRKVADVLLTLPDVDVRPILRSRVDQSQAAFGDGKTADGYRHLFVALEILGQVLTKLALKTPELESAVSDYNSWLSSWAPKVESKPQQLVRLITELSLCAT